MVSIDAVLVFVIAGAAVVLGVYGAPPAPETILSVTSVAVITSALYVVVTQLIGGYRRHNEIMGASLVETTAKTFVILVLVLWALEHVSAPATGDAMPYLHLISVPQAFALAVASGLSAIVRLNLARQISKAYASVVIQPRRLAVVGDPQTAGIFLNRMPIWRWGYEMVGFFADDQRDTNANTRGISKQVLDLIALAREERIDDILIAVSDHDERRLQETIRQLCILPVRIYATPSMATMTHKGLRQAYLGSQPIFELVRPGLYGRRLLVKRGLDLIIALATLPVLMIAFPLIALAIKLESRGPVFFRQPRQGYNDRPFDIFKFRTMKVQETGDVVRQATKNDPRVTRVGAVLRKLSLDELPQIINVLRGDMSIIGPRPQVAKQNTYYGDMIDRYGRRHTVLPGITGWAQISGLRGETKTPKEMAKRIEADLHYVENWSLLLDFYILFRTMFVFFSKNAY